MVETAVATGLRPQVPEQEAAIPTEFSSRPVSLCQGGKMTASKGGFFACSPSLAGIELFYKLDHSHPNLSRVLHRQSGPRENLHIGTSQRTKPRANESLRFCRCSARLAG